jgi:metal transporter CNNM
MSNVTHCVNATANELAPLSIMWWEYVGAAIGCVAGAALAAGLTMGLVSLADDDLHEIRLMEEEDCDGDEAKKQLRKLKYYAGRLIPLKKDHHLLLVTLLLVNAGVNEALPIFLDRVVPKPWMAILLSVTLVLIFGEIIPSAIFTGPNQLKIAASFSTIVTIFMWILRPVAWPIARVLDCCLGHGSNEEGGSKSKVLVLSLHRVTIGTYINIIINIV